MSQQPEKSNYDTNLKKHLARYAARRLGIQEQGVWKDQTYPHILPLQLRNLNFLESIRAEILDYLAAHREIRLHKYFHHLNSSQAFALNLFYPFFSTAGRPAKILNALMLGVDVDADITSWEFESVPDPSEGTNVDVCWRMADGVSVYCEVKLSEREFGPAIADERHLAKFENIYRPRLKGLVAQSALSDEAFVRDYQLLRNVALLSTDAQNHVVFLLPRANAPLRNQVERFKGNLTGAASRVHIAYVEECLESLAGNEELGCGLQIYATQMMEKYVPPVPTTNDKPNNSGNNKQMDESSATLQRFGDVSVSLSGHVALVEIHRPPHNFFDHALIRNLADAFESLDANPECRASVLAAEGKAFCAGANFHAGDEATSERPATIETNPLYAEAVRLFACKKPIVAAVHGPAIGGGLGLALVADFRVVCGNTRFAANFTALGIHPGFGITHTLPRLIGQQKANLLLYTARRIDGGTALHWGLADVFAAPEKVREEALNLAAEIAANAPLAVQSTRATMRAGLADAIKRATDHEFLEQQRLFATADHAEGVRAVTERRPGNFTGH